MLIFGFDQIVLNEIVRKKKLNQECIFVSCMISETCFQYNDINSDVKSFQG